MTSARSKSTAGLRESDYFPTEFTPLVQGRHACQRGGALRFRRRGEKLAGMRKRTLLRQAQEKASERTKYALANDARVELTRDGKSVYVLWLPEGADPANPRT